MLATMQRPSSYIKNNSHFIVYEILMKKKREQRLSNEDDKEWRGINLVKMISGIY